MAGTRKRLSAHFVIEEFDCHDGTLVQERDYGGLEYLCRAFLEPLRAKYGPVSVHSGFRTASYNRRIGGASNSFHVYTAHDGNDQAADVSCVHGGPHDWHRTLNALRATKRNGNGGLGLYVDFCHFDIRDYPANWYGAA